MPDGALEGQMDVAGVRANPDRAAQDDIIKARLEFKDDPKQYQAFIQSLTNGFQSGSDADSKVLQKIEFYDSKTSDVRTTAEVQALEANGDEFYKLLDNYDDSHHDKNFLLGLFNPGNDGKIGPDDIRNFMDEIHTPGTTAYNYVQQHPEVIDIVRGMPSGTFTLSDLLGKLGFSGDNTEQQFRSYYGENMPKNQTDYGPTDFSPPK
jgi:hypothetical protein